MYSHRDLLLHCIYDILPKNSLLPFLKLGISSVLTPSGALRNFWLFSPVGEYLEGAHFTGFSFRQCSNHARTCRTLHPSGTTWKLKQDLAMQSPIVRKHQLDSHARFIDDTLDPSCSLPSIHILRWETRLACEMQVALDDTARLVSEISVFDKKYQETCLACAHFLRRLRYCNCTNECSPEGNRCRKSKVRYDIKKYLVCVLKSPWKGQQCQVPTTYLSCLYGMYQIWVLYYPKPKSWVCTGNIT